MDHLERAAVERARSALQIVSRNDRPLYSISRVLDAVLHDRTVGGFEGECHAELTNRGAVAGRGGFLAPLSEFFRDLNVGTATAGGHTIAGPVRPEVVNELATTPQVIALGARVIVDLKADVGLPNLASGLATAWVGEGAAPAEASPIFGLALLAEKTLMGYVDFSRRLKLQSSANLDAVLRRAVARSLARAVDAAALTGAGTVNEPQGVVNTAGVQSVAIGANGGPLSRAILRQVFESVANANGFGSDSRPGFALNSKTAAHAYVVDDAGNSGSYLYAPGSALTGTLGGFPAAIDNSLRSSLAKGTGSNLSELVFGSWEQLVIGFFSPIEILLDRFTQLPNYRLTAYLSVGTTIEKPAAFAVVSDIVTT